MAKVLLVEDDNNLREIYQARLIAEGYDIVAAQNGEEALVVAKQNKPDLIISDVMMPRISGFEMLDILRNTDELKHTKVIMLTALGQAEDQKRADNLGADKYLVKSQVTLEDIVNAAKELLGEDGADATTSSAIADVPPAPASKDPIEEAPSVVTPAESTAPVVSNPETAPVTTTPDTAVPPSVAPPVTPAESVVPASAVPQPGTSVVVPPAPANPTPPTVTSVVMPPSDSATTDPAPAPEPAAAVPTAPTVTPEPADASQTDPVTVTPTEPVVAPSQVAATDTPAATPTSPAPTAAPEVAADSSAQTLEAEEAALEAQIATYAETPAPNAPAAADPAPAPEPAAASSNDQAIAEAVKELNTPTPEEPIDPPSVKNAQAAAAPVPAPDAAGPVATTVTPPAPVAAVDPATPPTPEKPASDDVSIAGKKVIKPLNENLGKPDLNALLAKEEAKGTVSPAPAQPQQPIVGDTSTASATPTNTQSSPTPPPATPGQSFDPNTVAL